ncbi:MAG: hypothetical protein DRI71_01625 [Bacteroidetes bacterium]|nr:MAG: hypothetical protein DRI71_01625 [Bacteroidota bacterium]
MKNISKIVATILAAFIGTMSVIAGIRVLLGIDVPDYHVMTWLVAYNVLLGVFSLAVAYLIWSRHKYALTSNAAVILSHSAVLLLLLTMFRGVAAVDSVKAMTFRIVVWTIILLFTYKSGKNEK